MSQFVYKVNVKGEETAGIIEAVDMAEASTKLQERGGYILMLKPRFSWGQINVSGWVERLLGAMSEHMGVADKILFTTQLGVMLKTGLPIVEAIEAFVEDKRTGSSVMLKGLVADLKGGKRLSHAMAAHPKVFDRVYVNVVRAGEEMGNLGETLVYLGDQLKREHGLMTKVRSALIYPVVVMTAMVAVMGFVVGFVIPKIAEFARSSGASLPQVTMIMINAAEWGGQNWLGMGGGMVAIGLVGWQGAKTKKGKRWLDGLVLKIPIVGELVRRYNQVRFCRLLAGFFKYGISVAEAFDILAASLGNSYYSESCLRLKAKLTLGRSFSEALATERELYPPIMAKVIKGAERTGVLDETLLRLAKFYERELKLAVKDLTSLIEPILIVMLGMGVVGVALAVVLPVYRLTSQIR